MNKDEKDNIINLITKKSKTDKIDQPADNPAKTFRNQSNPINKGLAELFYSKLSKNKNNHDYKTLSRFRPEDLR